MSIPDRDVPETLALIAKLLASVSERVDKQTDAVDELTQALGELATAEAGALERIVATQERTQERTQAAADPDRAARATAEAVRDALVPHLHKIVDIMQELNGGKAMLRERWRAFDREEARQGRWRFLPLGVTVGVPLALGLFLAALMPSAVAQTPFTCRAAGGLWWVQTERLPAVCSFEAHGRLHQATGEADQADASGS